MHDEVLEEVRTYSERITPIIYEGPKKNAISPSRDLVILFNFYQETIKENTIDDADDSLLTDDLILEYESDLKNSLSTSDFLKIQKRKNILFDNLYRYAGREDFNNYSEKIKDIISEIVLLDFEDAIVELSMTKSLIFKLKFLVDTILIINFSLENLESDNPLVVFTLLENKETIVNSYNTLENIIEGMQSYLVE